uniref:Uncharacterized protein n=1 Tax=Setaria italica TaxID=4555 RepID=K3YBF1_SETIT
MAMHVRDKLVSSCSLVYSGMHLGQLDKSYLFIVLRSPQVLTSEMFWPRKSSCLLNSKTWNVLLTGAVFEF